LLLPLMTNKVAVAHAANFVAVADAE